MLNRQFLVLISFLIIFGLGSGVGAGLLFEKFYLNAGIGYVPTAAVINRTIKADINEKKQKKELPIEITLIFVGDIMLDRGVKKKIETVGGGDFRFPFLRIANILKEADIVSVI